MCSQMRALPMSAVACIGAVMLLCAMLPTCSSISQIRIDNDALAPTKYSEWSQNITYLSKTTYNARGMNPLYQITHKILWAFVGHNPLPAGYVVVEDMTIVDGPKAQNNEWFDLVKHYWATILLVLVVGILIVAIPVIGLCFCCCRCAGACGGRSEPFDKKHDTCRRVCLGLILIVLSSGFLFGVIVAFATNGFIDMGLNDATDAVRDGSKDTQKFLAVTSEQTDHLLVKNYAELSYNLKEILSDTSTYIIDQLERFSEAVSLVHLTDFLTKLPEIRDTMKDMKTMTNDLRVYASQLSDGLRGVKRDLLVMLTKCNISACQEILSKYEIGHLDANGIHYDLMEDRYFPKLPDLTEMIDKVDELVVNNIADAGERGRSALKDLRSRLNDTITKFTPQIIDSIDKAGQSFARASNEIKDELKDFSKTIDSRVNQYTGVADRYMEEYSPYRFYLGLAVSSVLLAIMFCLVAALLCGICGKRPGGYGDDCCNKGAGSRFLMLGVALIFLTMSGILLTALSHFLVGLVAHRGVCVPLKDSDNDILFAEFEKLIDLNKFLYHSETKTASGTLPPFRLSHVINSCFKNQSIYEVLRFHNRFDIHDIKEYPAQYKINSTLDSLVNGLDYDNFDITILQEADKTRILELGNSVLSDYSSSRFIDNLNESISKHSLTEIAIQLRSTANKITNNDLKDVQVSLRNQALHLESYEQNLVIPMKNHTKELLRLTAALERALSYKKLSFKDAIPKLVEEIIHAQRFIKEDGRQFVQETTKNLTHYFFTEIDRYLDRVIYAVENDIGVCAPLATVYSAGVVTVCNNVVDPLNGFWAGLFWCCLLFVPILIIAVKLAGLYQKSDPYPGPLVESEYLYDAYSERDHIPLANGPKNKRRKSKDRRRRGDYYEDPMAAAQHGVPSAAVAGGVRDTRYNDMAPKHWDGGPPRYQNPPMAPPASEYERPPPYYYPGATEQD